MRYAVAAICAVVCIALRLKGIEIFSRMKHQVNERMLDSDRIPEFGSTALQKRVINLHKGFYPASSLRRSLYSYWAASVIAGILAIALVVQVRRP